MNEKVVLEYMNIKIEVNTMGAEIKSFIVNNKEILWNKKEYWNKTSPVLFPFIGGIKDQKYIYDNKEYHITKHGFARDKEFKLISKNENSLTFLLEENSDTLNMFPFHFKFYVIYTIKDNMLDIEYKVVNVDKKDMYFILGFHPAFIVNNNSYIEFDKKEISNKYILKEGLINGIEAFSDKPYSTINISDKRILDTIIFEKIESKYVYIRNGENDIKIDISNFKHLAIWKVENADFLCIEPWMGLPSNYDVKVNKLDEMNMIHLVSNSEFSKHLIIEVIN